MPADAQHSYLKSLGFLAMGEKVKALEELEHSVKLAPESSVDSLVLKGKILWSMNNEVEGNEAFWDAFSLSGNHPDVLEFVNIMRPLAEKWYDKATQAVLDDRLD